jgi:hypothetical protein
MLTRKGDFQALNAAAQGALKCFMKTAEEHENTERLVEGYAM